MFISSDVRLLNIKMPFFYFSYIFLLRKISFLFSKFFTLHSLKFFLRLFLQLKYNFLDNITHIKYITRYYINYLTLIILGMFIFVK